MRIIATIAVVSLIAAIAQHASAGMKEDCVQSDDRDLQIGGCTAVIQSGMFADNPGNLAIIYNNRGNAYGNLGEHRRAIEDYDQALRLDSNYPDAYNNRAMSLYRMGRNAEALGDVDRALALVPGAAYAIDTRAHVLAALGRSREAQNEFERAMQIGGADRVRKYQEALAKHGYYQGAIDGAYGAATRAALAACLDAGCRVVE